MLRTPLVVVAAMAMIAFSPGTASASQDPVGDLLGQLRQTADQLTSQLAPASTPLTSTPLVSTPPAGPAPVLAVPPKDPATGADAVRRADAPDRTAAKPVDLVAAGQKVATVASSGAAVNNDDGTKADSTLVALGGQEIFGAHADSTQQTSDHFGDFLKPLCDASTGQLCLEMLYADADATDNGSTSHAQSRSGLLNACLGGTSTEAGAPCTGPLHAQILTSQSGVDRNQASGRTTGNTDAKAAGVCLQPDPVTAQCALDTALIPSQGTMDSAAAQPAEGSSSVFDLNAAGTDVGSAAQPIDPSLLPECVVADLACVSTNQGETSDGSGAAGHDQDGLKLAAVPMLQGGLLAGLGHTETLVHSADSSTPPGDDAQDPGDNGAVSDGDVQPAAKTVNASASVSPSTGGSVLPNTGGVWSGLLGLGLLLLGAGAFITTRGRRESRA